MDFKALLGQLSQLSEATKETPTGKIHKADPGGYGRKFDTDEEGDEKKDDKKAKADAPKRGRGRPKKGADSDTGEVKSYGGAKELQSFMVGNLPKGKLPGKPGKKHSIKEWIEEIENKYVAEGQLDELSPQTLSNYARKAAGQAKWARGAASALPGRAELDPMNPLGKLKREPVSGSEAEKYEKFNQQRSAGIKKAVAKGGKHGYELYPGTYGTPDDPVAKRVARQQGVKEAAPGQQLTVKPMPGAAQLVDPASNKVMATGDAAAIKNVQGAVAQGKMQMRGEEKMAEGDEDYSAKKARAGKDIGKPGKQFAKIAKSAGEKYGSKERGEKVAGAVLAKLRKKVSEADIPSDQVDMGAGLGAGRSAKTFEGKKPDFLDLDKDGNKKESMKKAAQDKKQKVSESAHRHSAAKLLGKAHALAKEAYNCKYDDLEEVKMYHEGYKEGLDECYGQGVYEMAPSMPPATPGGMAQQAMEADVEEGNAFTAALARTPKGGQFSVGGKTFTDRTSYDSKVDEMTFESLDKQLDALLNEDSVSEGMSVSISKGNQGSPDSVTVTAQDGEADELLGLIKQAGLGLFGDNQVNQIAATKDDGVAHPHGEIDVIDDHDGMMSLIKKLGGSGPSNSDYEDEHGHEEHDHEEEQCEGCGMQESQCECESVEETESYDQETEEVAEENAPDSDAAETTADENAEAEEDQALAQMNEWANDAGNKSKDFKDESFTTPTEFMTKTISGGLNKPKSTGQTTVPVVAGQMNRMIANESITDWKKLAGIK